VVLFYPFVNYRRQFQYNKEIIGEYIDLHASNPGVSADVDKWLSHILNAFEIWISRVEERQAECGVWDLHSADKMHEMNALCHSKIMELLESGNLHRVHSYQNSSGETFTNSLDEILTHLIIHSAHHRAQISCEWSRANVKPPVCDFIFWARQQAR